ncbi:hypothetical protein Pedsa_0571 [Pseudopedobacter saltans DSM 12145]|uniref:Uncharacterized protein n=2 Tax=Pseudopedobacter saltans TaxID=151895 RepID=F0S7C5_PSESL|nr:hypothetical protein Pedsa_0571 [Pseudopedobacter saltans DSM 12145]
MLFRAISHNMVCLYSMAYLALGLTKFLKTMKKDRLITNYSKYNDVALDFKAKQIVESLTENDNFPTTVPSLQDFTALSKEFNVSLNKARTGDKVQIAYKNQLRKQLLSNMQELAINVESQAFNDRSKLMSSGFDVSSNSGITPIITAPKNFTLSDGSNIGEIKLNSSGSPNAISYVHEYTYDELTEEAKWNTEVSSSKAHVFKNLASSKRIYARTRVVGRKGQEVYSNTLSRVVQ